MIIRDDSETTLPGELALPLLKALHDLGNTTTVILHEGCVFEFKGVFPGGEIGEGFYNLEGPVPGFHGHIRLDAITQVRFQDRPHRGRASYAFVFENSQSRCIFKVFLGRSTNGEIIAEQLRFFKQLREYKSLPVEKETNA
jgi:hypothetical protein